jgi:hypothetical protein
MTRSRRKTPILPMTAAESEKDDKRIASRKERSRVTAGLTVQAAADGEFDFEEFGLHPRSGQWTFSKDGGYHAGSRPSPQDRKRLRK